MYKKILLAFCITGVLTTGCAKRENPLLAKQPMAKLSELVKQGAVPGTCRDYYLSPKDYPSRQADCDKKADELFKSIEGKEPFLQVELQDIKSLEFWQAFYQRNPNFDFFYS